MKIRGLAALLVAAALGANAAPPNVLFIISDDHGWTDYSFMGHPQVQTPCLDRLAAQSLTFRRGYVPSSLCCPSLAAIVTGLYPHQSGITCNDPPGRSGSPGWIAGRAIMTQCMESLPTLPRLLGERGYVSLQTGKWWQGDFRSGGFTQGMTKGKRHGDEGLDIGRKTMQPIYDFIEAARKDGKPWLVWYAPMMPHHPHTPPERLLQKYVKKTDSIQVAKYWAMVEWFDETCGQLLDYLDREKLAENTIVLYVADNGWIQSPSEMWSVRSKLTPYDGGLRTPIMIRWPGRVAPRMSDELAISIDFAPTVLAALGIKPTPAMQGVNLLDAEAVRSRKAICGECFVHTAVDMKDPAKNLLHRWATDGRWKLIVSAKGSSPELYDLQGDPAETHNLAGDPAQGEELKRMRGVLDAWIAGGSDPAPGQAAGGRP